MASKPNNHFFRPPPETFSLFDDVEDDDEDVDNQIGEEPQVSTEPTGVVAGFSRQEHDQDDDDEQDNLEEEDDDAPVVFLNQGRFARRKKPQRLPKRLRTAQPNAAKRQRIVQAPPATIQQQTPPRSPSEAYHPPPAPARIRTAGGGEISILNTNCFMTGAQRKKIEQLEKIQKAEADLNLLLGEDSSCSPNDKIKLLGKLMHVQTWKTKLEEGGAEELLNGSEMKILYEIGRQVEKRQVANEARAFARLAQATAAAGDGGGGRATITIATGKGKKRAREDDDVFLPTYHPTVGGKTVPKDVDYEDDDCVWEGVGEADARPKYGGKTIPGGGADAFHVDGYDVGAVLEGDTDANDEEESEDEDEDDDDGRDASDADSESGEEKE